VTGELEETLAHGRLDRFAAQALAEELHPGEQSGSRQALGLESGEKAMDFTVEWSGPGVELAQGLEAKPLEPLEGLLSPNPEKRSLSVMDVEKTVKQDPVSRGRRRAQRYSPDLGIRPFHVREEIVHRG
jgi:hypothetical protein